MNDEVATARSAPEAVLSQLAGATADGQARAAALRALPAIRQQTTSLVSYQSRGSLLIVGKQKEAFQAARALKEPLRCAVLLTSAAGKVVNLDGRKPASRTPRKGDAAKDLEDIPFARGKLHELSGHLGAFQATVATPRGASNLAQHLGLGREHFDLVLDLATPPHIQRDTLPPGYYAPGGNKKALAKALAELPELVGEFEKPRYFSYDPGICAHSRSGVTGCTRCIDACPTLAIHSIGDTIEVDPYLCQGGGSCATACPSGAITYAYPAVSDLLSAVRGLLKAYRDAGGKQPVLLFHGADSGREPIMRLASALPENVIPVEVEEVGSIGMEAWLSALAYGASHVALFATPELTASVRRELTVQLGFGRAILEGMGYAGDRLQLIDHDPNGDALASLQALTPQPELRPGSFAAMDEKRTTIRLATDYLYAQAPARSMFVELPSGAPFGEIRVDRSGCTLCMACAGVCPHSALSTGEELPQLLFDEWNCVQCGICETACPENVITLAPRFIYDAEIRRATRTLNEEAPFLCIVCGKPFATKSMMNRMQEKLKGHWMFQKPEAMRRMQMCDDCRVKDMLIHEGLVDVHKKP